MKSVPIILAGGIGERFWPMSRSSRPKQLLNLYGSQSMIEQTFSRLSSFCKAGVKPLIVTAKNISEAIGSSLKDRHAFDMIIEPVGKNTAPAIALAAAWITHHYGADSVMIVLPADHAIAPESDFVQAVHYAITIASQQDQLVVFGITPTRPDIGYGYINLGIELGSWEGLQSYPVNQFIEKPDIEKAKHYCKSLDYVWNSGMFVWKASVILEEFHHYLPSIYDSLKEVQKAQFSQESIDTFYHNSIKESIDYGIMEKSKRVTAVRGMFTWDDLGSWESLARLLDVSPLGSVTKGTVFEDDCKDCIIVNESSRPVAAIGLENVVVVSVNDALLCIDRQKLGLLKNYLARIRSEKSFPASLF